MTLGAERYLYAISPFKGGVVDGGESDGFHGAGDSLARSISVSREGTALVETALVELEAKP